MVDSPKIRMTADEYLALPETMQRMDLIDGEVIVSPSPSLKHQDIGGNTYILLREKAKALGGKAYIAPLDVVFDEWNIPQPDVFYLAPNSRCVPFRHILAGPPELIVEIISPGNTRKDKQKKFELYERFGVLEYWLVDPPKRSLEVWQLKDGKFVLLEVYGPGETFESSVVGAVHTTDIFGA